MAKEKDDVRKHANVGQLPRYSRPVRVYLNEDNADYVEPIKTWSHNFSIIKELQKEEENLLQK